MWVPHFTFSTIRKKLLVAMVGLGVIIAVLGYSSFSGVYAYRDLAATLGERAVEIPMTADLTRAIDELRNEYPSLSLQEPLKFRLDYDYERERRYTRFSKRLEDVRASLNKYRSRLEESDSDDLLLADRTEELSITSRMEEVISKIELEQLRISREQRELYSIPIMQEHLVQLSNLAHDLPTQLAIKMASFREEVRDRYRTWIVLTWSSALLSGVMLVGVVAYARRVVIRPFKELLAGARRVAGGDFTSRIGTNSKDELSELADAINLGVASFLSIQSDLNEQVRERSREVIRNEQLASVGFLAAGVAHEINNPLASIAWSAEALESRLHRILHSNASHASPSPSNLPPSGISNEVLQGVDVETLRTYLKRIQDEAFRCKGITERLLDFSRLGTEERRQYIDLTEIIEDVVGMVRHLGQCRSKQIVFDPPSSPMMAWASGQEMKQVVLNLLTNALESIDATRNDGKVSVTIAQRKDHVNFTIEDNGGGMSEDVLLHIFEPFYTRRRDGRGTGLGLPITSRIIADHGGRITVKSLGIGVGSRFEVSIPCQPTEEKKDSIVTPTTETREIRHVA